MRKRLLAVCLTVFLLLGLAPTVFAAPIGTTPGNPVVVSLGQTYSCSWTRNTDHLYCYNKIMIPASGMLHFQIDKLNDSEGELCKYDIALYDAAGDVVIDYDGSYSVDLPKSTYDYYIGLPAGEYTMNIKPGFIVRSGTFTANYSFSFEEMPCELEPNESKSTATTLPMGQMLRAYYGQDGIGTSGANDYFKCALTKGAKYRITFKNFAKLIGPTTAIFHVYTPSGSTLYNLGDDQEASVDDEGNTYWEYVAEQSGTYYFRLFNYRGPQITYGLKISMASPFVDVPGNAYYYTPVLWAVQNGITSGTTPTTFSPNAGCTRAQVVAFLWRAAGSPMPGSSRNPFTDVKSNAYYYNAVLWAVENGITAGTSETTFSPDKICTRAQIVTFLWRYEDSPAPASDSNPFTDVNAGAYYAKAVLWASQTGVTAGLSSTTFGPEATCTRAQVVSFLYRDIAKQ